MRTQVEFIDEDECAFLYDEIFVRQEYLKHGALLLKHLKSTSNRAYLFRVAYLYVSVPRICFDSISSRHASSTMQSDYWRGKPEGLRMVIVSS